MINHAAKVDEISEKSKPKRRKAKPTVSFFCFSKRRKIKKGRFRVMDK